MLIRPATRDDEDRLGTIHLATWTTDVSPAGAPAGGFRFFRSVTEPDDVLVAVTAGVVRGYVWLHRTGLSPSHDHVLVVDGLAVDPASQGQGLGRALVDAAIDEVRRRGGRKLTLRVLATNAPARRLYESAGFRVEGVLHEEFLLDDVHVSDVLMARDLRSGR